MRWIPLLLVVAIAYTNCSKEFEMDESGFVLGDPRDVNNFKSPPPSVICGKSGYDFLLKNYIRSNCGACHGEGGIAFPQFTASGLNDAHWAAQLVPRERWIATITENRFCGPSCNLSITGQMYGGFVEWLENPANCP